LAGRDGDLDGRHDVIRVVLADDQAVVRDGLVLLLSAAPDVEVVGAASDGEEAIELVRREQPDVALLDLRMPKKTGDQVAAALAEHTPSVKVLVLTTFADDAAILPALRAGAAGYLTKDASGEELVGAIRAVAAGRTVLDPSVQRRLVELVAGAPEPAATPEPEPEAGGLTRREVDVVRLVAEGLSNQQIARRLVVSEATVKTHLNHVLSKLDVDGRPGLVAWAWRHGLAGR
jgi:DNA-binding NarL/FixJ family response regulator